MMFDSLTILTKLPNRSGETTPATKTLNQSTSGVWQKSNRFNFGRMYKYSSIPVADIFTLHKALLKISRHHYSFCIRGKLKDGIDPLHIVYRRSDSKNGETANFEEKPCYWLMLDFDKVRISEMNDLFDDPENAVEDLIYRHLPKLYHDVTCVWQLSSGAATTDPDGTLSLHLWFWLDQPIGQYELTCFHAVHAPSVDRSVFRTVQPLFTAAPIFTAPFRDPLPRRIGLMQREYDRLTLPFIEKIYNIRNTPKQKRSGLISNSHGFEAKLKLLGDGPGLNGFNGVIPAAVASMVNKRHPYEINIEAIECVVRSAINRAPVSINRSEQDLIRYSSDQYIRECIRTAVSKYCLKTVTPLYPASTMSVSDVRTQFFQTLNSTIGEEIKEVAT